MEGNLLNRGFCYTSNFIIKKKIEGTNVYAEWALMIKKKKTLRRSVIYKVGLYIFNMAGFCCEFLK